MTLNFIIEFESKAFKTLTPDKIRFTSSKNNQTATLTLTFFNPKFLLKENELFGKKNLIKSMSFIYENYKFSTKDINIIWLKGKPLILEVVFLITSEVEAVKLKKLFKSYSEKNVFS